MTEATIQKRIQILLNGDSDTPTSTGDEYLLRREIINQGIGVWEKEAQWTELFAKLSDAADGDTVTVASQAAYDCPTNFLFPVGYLRVETTSSVYYPFKPLQSLQLIGTTDSTTKFCYITGNPQDGYDITIHPTPGTAGYTITYEYYKTADLVTATTTVPEMSDPLFLVDYSLHHLRRRAGDINGSREALASASSRLDVMKERNAATPWYTSTKIPDIDLDIRGISGFGV